MSPVEGASPPDLETLRLRLRRLEVHDAPFIRDLMSDSEVIRQIGDRGVRTTADAKRYIADGPMAMYKEHGFGLMVVETRSEATRIGICGIVRRPALEAPDLGFAFLGAHRGHGFATESGAAVLEDAADRLGLSRVMAITAPGNAASQRVLGKLGFVSEGLRPIGDASTPSAVFSMTLRSRNPSG